MKIGIIDYGMGNIKSVYNALKLLGYEPIICSEPCQLDDPDRIILPGVGSFKEAMYRLNKSGWVEMLNIQVLENRKSFLGICLGMQLILEDGTENGLSKGFGWIKGSVNKIKCNEKDFKLPHIGWNSVKFIRKDGLFKDLGEEEDFYFVNSYAAYPENMEDISALTNYDNDFVSAIEIDNIHATQFHPEKSQRAGLKVLENFVNVKVKEYVKK